MYVENVEMQLNRLPSHSVSLLDTINIASIGVNNTNSAVYSLATLDRKKSSLLVAKIYSGQYLKIHPIFTDRSDYVVKPRSRGNRDARLKKSALFEKIKEDPVPSLYKPSSLNN